MLGDDARTRIDHFIRDDEHHAAVSCLTEVWRAERGPSCAAFVVSRYERMRPHLALPAHRLAIVRSFTVEPIVPLLRAEAFTLGIDLTVHVGSFNAYAVEMLDANSSLYGFAPDTVILAVLAEDVAPDLTRDYADLTPEAAHAAVERVTSGVHDWVRAFRSCSQANLIIPTLERPAAAALGVLDAQTESGQTRAIEAINHELKRLARTHRGVYVLDYDALVARHGRRRWRDERRWLTARMPVAAEHLIDVAREWMRFLAPLSGKSAKVLAVDLDNTLWGGVIGEDGMNGIQLGTEYPGACYRSLQRAILDLSRRGVLLALCSKNNADDALEAIGAHPGMLLRPHHFAAMRINWADKAQSLREIAAELNIGIDAVALIDDSPVECAQVRSALPEVTVIQLSGDPSTFADTLRECPVFERLSLSVEDAGRTGLYEAQAARSQAARRFESKDDFYRFLEQEVEIAPVAPETVARVSQLTQKTNQFNVTTRRYSEQQIAEMSACPGCRVHAVRVRDRYGDQGIVGVAITRDHAQVCDIDTFLLSCRVIGRTVESALLSFLAQSAAARGRSALVGSFVPTRKNTPARDLFAGHGFTLREENGEGSVWSLDLTRQDVHCPSWITLRVENDVDINRVPAGSNDRR